jgi:hypothetical protein
MNLPDHFDALHCYDIDPSDDALVTMLKVDSAFHLKSE